MSDAPVVATARSVPILRRCGARRPGRKGGAKSLRAARPVLPMPPAPGLEARFANELDRTPLASETVDRNNERSVCNLDSNPRWDGPFS